MVRKWHGGTPVTATRRPRPSRERRKALSQADVDLTKLRFYLSLCQDLRLITPRQYRHVAEIVAEIGRLLGGWQKVIMQ